MPLYLPPFYCGEVALHPPADVSSHLLSVTRETRTINLSLQRVCVARHVSTKAEVFSPWLRLRKHVFSLSLGLCQCVSGESIDKATQ